MPAFSCLTPTLPLVAASQTGKRSVPYLDFISLKEDTRNLSALLAAMDPFDGPSRDPFGLGRVTYISNHLEDGALNGYGGYCCMLEFLNRVSYQATELADVVASHQGRLNGMRDNIRILQDAETEPESEQENLLIDSSDGSDGWDYSSE